jgi:NAD(P)-dependent dehydrogenase (short-subunit alcohol dehydrogenase family)
VNEVRKVLDMPADERPLAGSVAIVAGATRGAGRGIARGLGEAGATVYCTGRSTTGHPSPYKRPETIDETAELIHAGGGTAIPVRVDHTVESEVEALFKRVVETHGRVDILVNSIAGEDPRGTMAQWCSFWKTKLDAADSTLRQSLLSHIITAKHAALHMIEKKRGLIVEVTENDGLGAGGNPITQTVKVALKTLALNMAAELQPFGVTALSVTPGFLRSEAMLERFHVTEANWRDGGKKDKNFLESETPLFLGRGVAALAADPALIEHSGMLFSSWELGRKYGVTDADGRRPDWGAHTIDFSGHPKSLIDLLRVGSELQRRWLRKVSENGEALLKKFPPSGAR